MFRKWEKQRKKGIKRIKKGRERMGENKKKLVSKKDKKENQRKILFTSCKFSVKKQTINCWVQGCKCSCPWESVLFTILPLAKPNIFASWVSRTGGSNVNLCVVKYRKSGTVILLVHSILDSGPGVTWAPLLYVVSLVADFSNGRNHNVVCKVTDFSGALIDGTPWTTYQSMKCGPAATDARSSFSFYPLCVIYGLKSRVITSHPWTLL